MPVLSLPEQRATFALIMAITALVVCYDLGMDAMYPKGTISAVIKVIFRHYPITFVMFVVWLGILIGHLFPTN